MDELKSLIDNMMNAALSQIVLSDSRSKELAVKVKVRPILVKGELKFQETLYRGNQVFHHNYEAEEMSRRLLEMLEGHNGEPWGIKNEGITEEAETPKFGQAQFAARDKEATVLVSKKGKTTIKCRQIGSSKKRGEEEERFQDAEALAHNKSKKYILQEGIPVDFLVGLGVQLPNGQVAKAKYDKFRQINRYLEFIEDVLEELPNDRTIRIIDFGCGKSYLTFAMYYYLHIQKGRQIQVTGLDLKADVIEHCNELAQKCGYDRLHFEKGDISTYTGEDKVDMVVTLHACDTATDFALEKAVKWGAKVIMAVPCCQHEVNRQIHCEELKPLLKYGLIKERMAALITDAVRANLLTSLGYDTQILEFIDMEHTPKNLLIRAVKRKGMRPGKKEDMEGFLEYLGISPTLARLLEEVNEKDNH